MTTAELLTTIRAEIERLKEYAISSKMEWINEGYNQNAFAEDCRIASFDSLLSFLDTLEEPDKCKGCNNVKGCIACVDGDQWAHYEEPVCEELEDEIKRYIPRDKCPVPDLMEAVASHFAEWQKAQDDKMVDIIYQQGIEKGKDEMKEQMMKKAIEEEVYEIQN
jgi:predicted Mrr-cat superfamily restriction endonuclease